MPWPVTEKKPLPRPASSNCAATSRRSWAEPERNGVRSIGVTSTRPTIFAAISGGPTGPVDATDVHTPDTWEQSTRQQEHGYAAFVGGDYIPIIDLTEARAGDVGARRQVAAAIDAACRQSGFLVVRGHGIDPALIAEMHRVTLELF